MNAALLARCERRVFNRLELDNHASLFDRCLWPMVFSDSVRFEWRDHHAIEGSYRLAGEFLNLPDQPPELDFRPMHFDAAAARMRVPSGFTLSPSRLVVHCGTRLASKAWPDERWVELLGQLAPHFEQIFLSAGPFESEGQLVRRLTALAPAKVFAPDGPLPWSQLAALLQGARLFAGVDTAAMHLAAACHCPSLVIWGPVSAVIFGPRAANSAIMIDDRIVRPPFGAGEAYDEARAASRNSTATVLKAAGQLLSEQMP